VAEIIAERSLVSN